MNEELIKDKLNGCIYESNLNDVSCEKGVSIFSEIIEKDNSKNELYKCNKCGYEVKIKHY